jgi:hypothetical protein
MEPNDLTIEILQGIREEARKTNDRLDTLVDRMDRLENRQAQTEVRLATELTGVAGAVREVRDLLREDRALRQRVDDHERRLTAIEQRTA